MDGADKRWARILVTATVRRPRPLLAALAILTALALLAARGLDLRMNWIELLPGTDPAVRTYLEIQERFGDPSVLVSLEGPRERTVAMAEELEPRLRRLPSLRSVRGKAPASYFLRHGFVLLKPGLFDRALRRHRDPSLVGSLRGLNEDLEREYAESEENLRRDEMEVARGLFGLTRTIEVLAENLAERPGAPPIEEGVETMLVGDPWPLSLDRKLLLVSCTPLASITDFEGVLRAVEDVEATVNAVAPSYPEIEANLCGLGKISQEEMRSIGFSTQLLSVIAIVLIYFLLVRSLRSWILPVIAIAPLAAGIIWTMGLMEILFDSLNLFTVMMMLVLLGLGIDFSIHMISRFFEERGRGTDIDTAAARMLGGTGKGVFTGALTTAAAFFALTIADTKGVFEFGAAAGSGVLLTLVAIFLLLPPILAWRERRATARQGGVGIVPGSPAHRGWPLLGRIAAAVWRKAPLVLFLFAILSAASFVVALRTAFEYDFLELEPAGLTSVRLERALPARFGVSNQVAWAVAPTIEESRRLKNVLEKKGVIAEVNAISDYLPPEERRRSYEPRLIAFRRRLDALDPAEMRSVSATELAAEIDRLWDNLDLMGNLAFEAGLDRIVKTIDGMTGYDAERDVTDSSAILPALARLLSSDPATAGLEQTQAQWATRMRKSLLAISDPSPITIDQIPEAARLLHLPRDGGGGYLLEIRPRGYMYDKARFDRFTEQTAGIDRSIVGTPKVFLVMTEETLRDGRNGAILASFVIVLLLFAHFRGPIGLLALIPLAGGALFMLGAMHLVGMKYNYMNLIAIPIILGIGIDDGVHAIHRFREGRGSGVERISSGYRFVGFAILLTSLTTMVGFGSVAFYEMRGMASFGIVLFLGVGFCFLTTVLVLPAVLRVFTRRPRSGDPS